jgi:hypothetical protein
MQPTSTLNLDWWLDQLDATPSGDGYMALCPAHDDYTPSLSITPMKSGDVRVHCFAGCTYKAIIEALESGEKPDAFSDFTITKRKKKSEKLPNTPNIPLTTKASEWWLQYTGVPIEEWESWGARFTDKEIIFGWKDLVTEKYRIAGTKEMKWRPVGCAAPPLWPQLPAALSERIFMIEGETDCGVFRHLGFPAYAMMKGVSAVSKTSPMWPALYNRGCREIVFVLDLDDASQKQLDTYVEAARGAGIRTFVLRLNAIIDPLLGEKDPRDVWVRTHDPRLKIIFEQNIVPIGTETKQWMDIMTFMKSTVLDAQWIVKDILLQNTVGMIVGMPKLGKTWLAHDLMISIATGKPFMGHFPVHLQGPVVYISKEDPDPLLHDRFAKMLAAKGEGGSVSADGQHITFPPANPLPVFIDLDRDFMFNDEGHMRNLMDRLKGIVAQYGYIALIIFDPVLKMIPADVDVNNATEINNAIFAPAEKIQRETGTSVLLVHHRSKGGAEGKASYGSIGFQAFSASTQYLMGDEPDKDGWVHVRGEFKSAAETAWAYRLNDLTSEYAPEVDMGARTPTRKTAIRDLITIELKNNGPMNVKDLVSAVGATEATVRDVLSALEGSGEVDREQDMVTRRTGGRPKESWRLKIRMPGGPE